MDQIQLRKLDIIMDNDQINYETGDLIKGKCLVVIDGQLPISWINIVLMCVGEIKWFEPGPQTRYHHHDLHKFQAKKIFMELVYKHPEECENEILNKGVHSIDFEFELPRGVGLPSSFQGQHGGICYYLETNITSDAEQPPLTKTNPLVLNVAAPIRNNIWMPIGTDTEKEVGYFGLIGTGNIKLCVSLGRKGWAPGEKIILDIVTYNDSSLKVTPRATLYETRVFLTANRHHSIEKHYDAVVGKSVEKNEPGLDQLLITVNDDIPLTMKNQLMVVKHFLHITLDIPHELDIHINLPIIITTKRALEEAKMQLDLENPYTTESTFDYNELNE